LLTASKVVDPAYQPESVGHSIVFFSHNKSTSVLATAAEIISQMGPKYQNLPIGDRTMLREAVSIDIQR
jgi:hypothetical protein